MTATAANDRATQADFERTAPAHVVGRTYTKYPEQPTEVPERYPQVSLPYGVKLEPYAGQVPGPDPYTKSFVRPGTPQSTARHEQVHAESRMRRRPADRSAAWFNALAPRERLEYAAVKANYDQVPRNSHAAFADVPGGEEVETDQRKVIANRIQELQAVKRVHDRRGLLKTDPDRAKLALRLTQLRELEQAQRARRKPSGSK